MKFLVILAVLGLMAVIIGARPRDHEEHNPDGDHNDDDDQENHRGDNEKEDHKHDGNKEDDKPDDDKEDHKHDSDKEDHDDDDDDENGCVCGTQCDGNNGTKRIACHESRTQYLQCVEAVCSNQTCAADQLFNSTSGLCELCHKGFHVDATKRRCVCDKGTTFNFTTGVCVRCPTSSIETADRCFCSNTTALNKAADACQACPADSNRTREGCECNDKKHFWNEEAFACQSCPGSWVNKSVTEHGRLHTFEVCECKVSTDVFNKETVTCAPCPANSILVTRKYGNYCRCTTVGQEYDEDTNTCVDRFKPDKHDRRD